MLGELDRWWEGNDLEESCVDNRLCKGDWIVGRKGKEWGNWVLIADCFRVI